MPHFCELPPMKRMYRGNLAVGGRFIARVELDAIGGDDRGRRPRRPVLFPGPQQHLELRIIRNRELLMVDELPHEGPERGGRHAAERRQRLGHQVRRQLAGVAGQACR